MTAGSRIFPPGERLPCIAVSVAQYAKTPGVRSARRRRWTRAFQICLALTATAAAIAIGALSGFKFGAGSTGSTSIPTSNQTAFSANVAPGIAITDKLNKPSGFDMDQPFMTTFGNTDYLYLGTPLGKGSENVVVVTGSPGHWDYAGAREVLPTLPSWSAPNLGTLLIGVVWNPEVFKFGSTYVMYFAVGVKNYHPTSHCIGVAQSNSPTGPFIPSQAPLVCQLNLGGSIDAQAFFDPSGPNGPQNPYYLIWKSDNDNLYGNRQATRDLAGCVDCSFYVQGLSNDGMTLTDTGNQNWPRRIFSADKTWQQGLVEAPQLTWGPDGSIYLFYSGGIAFVTPEYAVGVARCASITGPCTDLSNTPLIGSNTQGRGPGEECLYQGRDGSLWVLYDPWFVGDPARPLYRPVEAARIAYGRAGPYVVKKPGTFPSP
jgi:hypothetical protein